MSRLYHNTPLQSVPVKNINYTAKWNPLQHQNGSGVLLECTIVNRKRLCVTDNAVKKFRYYIFHVKLKRNHKRKFDSTGSEIEPNFSETKKVSTGFLPSSYRTDPKGDSDRLNNTETRAILTKPELVAMSGQPSPDCVYLWVDEAVLEKIELCVDDEVRVKTAGNSAFVESLSKIEGSAVRTCNFTGGDAVGSSWTDKIMAMKQDETADPAADEGVDEDEWGD